ncbi:MAG: hypothetical protein OXC44_04715 [Proteobacteria bacterium]|nr:hypothetical protein [Pseudomonadota bacterium]
MFLQSTHRVSLWRAVPLLTLLWWVGAGIGFGDSSKHGRISDEIESFGGHSTSMVGGGGAALDGLAAVRLNPSLLMSADAYRITAAYHWPSYGRSYYQLGIVDGTGPVKAGMVFSAPLNLTFDDPFTLAESLEEGEEVGVESYRDAFWGTGINQRFNLGLAYSVGKVALGVSGSYLRGWMRRRRTFTYTQEDGITFGGGASVLILPNLRVGASVEHLGNEAVRDLAPTFYRGSVAWLISGGIASLHADYLQRQRVRSEWVLVEDRDTASDPAWRSLFEDQETINSFEKMVIGSASLLIQDLVRLSAGFGYEFGDEVFARRTVGGGLALLSDMYVLSYSIKKPYFDASKLHQNLSLSVTIKL